MSPKIKPDKSYTELEVWKVAIDICNSSYLLTKQFPKEELFGLTNQIRRSATSIASNIAEGCGRNSTKDIMQFLFIARGSIYELETQIFIANNQKYISEKVTQDILNVIDRCKRLLNGLIKFHQIRYQNFNRPSTRAPEHPSTKKN